MMTLYYSDTLMPRKACAAALHLSLPVTFVAIDLAKGEQQTPAYRALNPNAKVPVLVDGETVIWESNAIMCHLARKAGSDMWPDDSRQVDVIRWMSWDAEHFTRAGGQLYFEHIIRERFGLGPPDLDAVARASREFRKYAEILDAHLEGRNYLVGDRLTIADFAVAACLPYAEPAKLPLDGLDNIHRWHARLEDLPAWRNPFDLAAGKSKAA